jgi:hypothetical protein
MHLKYRPRAARGSAMSMAIVVSVVLSSLVAALAWTAGTHSESTGRLSKADQAFFAAESGLQRAIWLCRHRQLGNENFRSPLGGTVNGYTYQVSWPQNSITQVLITSKASNDPTSATAGEVAYTLSQYITAGSTSVPAFYSNGDFDNKNIIINGDVATGGNYQISGNGTLNGDLYYDGNASDLEDVWGVIYPSIDVPTINFTDLYTTLVTNNPNKKKGFTTDSSFDFSTVPGTSNKVIYVDGDLTDPKIIGEGTLYVKGKITFTKANLKFGTPPSTSPIAPAKTINLVATETIKFDKRVEYYYGGIYTAKDFDRAQIDELWGIIYAGGKITPSNMGMSEFNVGEVPWFDPRGNSSSTTATLSISGFKGPLP